jgi:hypothetical protein
MTPDDEQPLTPQSNAELEIYFAQKLPKISNAMKQAAADQDDAELKRIAAGIASYQAMLSKWNDACGERASAKLIAVVQILGEMRDDIGAALRGELPGQADEGDEWKNSQD